MDRLEQYIEEHSSTGTMADNALLYELDRTTNLSVIQPKMVSGPVQGAFLTLITKILRPRLVLEIGTFTGYSALSIAAGLEKDAEIHTIEIDDELEEIARSFFERSPHGRKIKLHIGSALEVVPGLFGERTQSVINSMNFTGDRNVANALGKFDLIFIDGDKREYPDYYRMVMGDGRAPSMVHSGSVILTDNVLWYGKVTEHDAVKESDRMSRGIMEFNRMVAADPRVENLILPLRDGINLIRVK